MLPPNVAAHPPVADSCHLSVNDIVIILPLKIAALPPFADSCHLPVNDIAIMLPRNVAALPLDADSSTPVHVPTIMLPPNIAALPLCYRLQTPPHQCMFPPSCCRQALQPFHHVTAFRLIHTSACSHHHVAAKHYSPSTLLQTPAHQCMIVAA
jgi:hypothetical protein